MATSAKPRLTAPPPRAPAEPVAPSVPVFAAEGFIFLGGPTGEGDGDNALLIIDADAEETVRARLAADPWSGEVLTIESIRPWSVWLRGSQQAR